MTGAGHDGSPPLLQEQMKMTTMTHNDVAKTMSGLTKRMADAAVELAVYTILDENDGWISVHQGALRNLSSRGLVSTRPNKGGFYLTHEALAWLQEHRTRDLMNAMVVMWKRRKRRFERLKSQAEDARKRLNAINDAMLDVEFDLYPQGGDA
jgi:hypothetical protein